FWSLVDDLLNTLLYMLMGFELLAVDLGPFATLAALAAIPLALLTRLVSVGAPMLVFDLRLRDRGRGIALLTWAGLRGGVSVALALTLPPSPHRDMLLTVCYAVVIFTIVVQGLTMTRIVGLLYGKARPGIETE
ncbi:MAG: cation:proton antiporter, partial [Acetobacteraceae bacterium]